MRSSRPPSAAFDLPPAGEPTIGAVPAALPALAVPDVSLVDLRALLPAARGIALVGYSDSVVTGRAVARRMGYRVDPARELGESRRMGSS